MNRTPDVELVLRDYFAADGPTARDHVLDVVEERIGHQRQRRAWPFTRRTTSMTPSKLITALAAALVVTVVGYTVLVKQPGVGPSVSTPVASPTAAPSPVVVTDDVSVLTPGHYRFQPFDDNPTLTVVAWVETGWNLGGRWWDLVPPFDTQVTSGNAIVFQRIEGLFSDPCQWNRDGSGSLAQGDVEVGPGAIDLANALRAQTAYTVSTPSLISFGDVHGYEMEIQLPSELKENCDMGWVAFSGDEAGVRAQYPVDRFHLFILDVGGTRVVVNWLYYTGTPTADLQAMRRVIESFQFTP